MELSYEEQLQLDNSKEHLRVVLSNLRIASDELSTVFVNLEKAKTDLAQAQQDTERINRENSEALLGISLKQSAQNNGENSLNQKESEILELVKKSELKISDANTELEGINKQIALSKSKYDKFTIDKDREVKTHKEEVTRIKGEIGKDREDIRQRLIVKHNIENEIIRLSSEKEKAEKELNSFRDNSILEMRKISEEIEQEKDKIKNPLEAVRRETEKLEILRNDLEIIKTRLRDVYKDKNPEGTFPIELQ